MQCEADTDLAKKKQLHIHTTAASKVQNLVLNENVFLYTTSIQNRLIMSEQRLK